MVAEVKDSQAPAQQLLLPKRASDMEVSEAGVDQPYDGVTRIARGGASVSLSLRRCNLAALKNHRVR